MSLKVAVSRHKVICANCGALTPAEYRVEYGWENGQFVHRASDATTATKVAQGNAMAYLCPNCPATGEA